MPLVRCEVKMYMVEYVCDECNRGVMRPTNKVINGVTRDTDRVIHVCTNPKCRKPKGLPMPPFPRQEFEPVENSEGGKIVKDIKDFHLEGTDGGCAKDSTLAVNCG